MLLEHSQILQRPSEAVDRLLPTRSAARCRSTQRTARHNKYLRPCLAEPAFREPPYATGSPRHSPGEKAPVSLRPCASIHPDPSRSQDHRAMGCRIWSRTGHRQTSRGQENPRPCRAHRSEQRQRCCEAVEKIGVAVRYQARGMAIARLFLRSCCACRLCE